MYFWCSIRSLFRSIHVLTAYEQTPKVNKLKKIGKGFAVRKSWLDDTFSTGVRQDETDKSYKIWAPEKTDAELDEEIEQATKKLKLSIKERVKNDVKARKEEGSPQPSKITKPDPEQNSSSLDKSNLSKCAFIFSQLVQQQPYFPNLIRAIYCGGGLCLQDTRFFTAEQIFDDCEHFLYIGESRHLTKVLNQINLKSLTEIKSQIQFVSPVHIFKKVDKILTI